jgi:NitT/TauT family transport system substrate-binding protein
LFCVAGCDSAGGGSGKSAAQKTGSSAPAEKPVATQSQPTPTAVKPIGEVASDAKGEYTIAGSIYVWWMPAYYADTEGIFARHAEKQGIKINFKPMDYIPSVEAYVAKDVDGVFCTNMEALDMPAASGVDSTSLLIGDYSNGNDKWLARAKSLSELKGTTVSLVELSVSEYLAVRALEKGGFERSDVNFENVSDADVGTLFLANKDRKSIVTWNPIASNVLASDTQVNSIFDSSMIPGEILDMLLVNTEVLEKDPRLGRALVGAWYEIMSLVNGGGEKAKAAKESMAKLSNCSLAEFEAQMATTAIYWTPNDAIQAASSKELQEKMGYVRTFCFSKGLLGENAKSVDVVGIQYPDGTIQGDPNNVKLRFDTRFLSELLKGDK